MRYKARALHCILYKEGDIFRILGFFSLLIAFTIMTAEIRLDCLSGHLWSAEGFYIQRGGDTKSRSNSDQILKIRKNGKMSYKIQRLKKKLHEDSPFEGLMNAKQQAHSFINLIK